MPPVRSGGESDDSESANTNSTTTVHPIAGAGKETDVKQNGGNGARVYVNNTIPPAVRNALFKNTHAGAASDVLLESHAPPRPEDVCSFCALRGTTTTLPLESKRFRCTDCFAEPHICVTCAPLVHHHAPFHRILLWNAEARVWDKATPREVGIDLFLGHRGHPCPQRYSSPRLMTIVHEHGIWEIPVHFCNCRDTDTNEEPYQLLRVGLFSGSWKQPRTAFTLNVLRQAHLLAHHAHTTHLGFVTYLKHSTDDVNPEGVPDRYREYLQAMREFASLHAS